MTELKEQEKVQKLYGLIGERGLYVSTNYDIFTRKPEEIPLLLGTGYKIPLIDKGTKAYSSPLLFATLTSLLNHGTMILTGAPGIGKTTSVEYAGHFFTGTPLDQILEAEILGNPQLKTEDVVASLDTVKMISKGEKEVIPTAFLKCPVKIWDEINRTPAELTSVAMKLVDIGKAVYQGVLLKATPGPLFATANYTDEGTFQLTPPFLDRFDVAVMVTSPQPWDLRKIRERGDEKLNGTIEDLLEIPKDLELDFEKIRKEIKNISECVDKDIPIVSAFVDFVCGSLRFSEAASQNIVRATKGNACYINQDNAPQGHFIDSSFNYTLNELSVRTSKAIPRYAKAFAWLNGRDRVELQDLKTVLPYLLWHKLQPSQKALSENQIYENDRIAFVEDLVQKIETEYNEALNSNAIKYYALALNALREGKLNGKVLNEDDIRKVVRNSILKIGELDKPYAITLANHLASEYNLTIMKNDS